MKKLETVDYLRHNYIQEVLYKLNLKLADNGINLYYLKNGLSYKLNITLNKYCSGYILVGLDYKEFYEILERWEKLNYWSLLIEIFDNIDLSFKNETI